MSKKKAEEKTDLALFREALEGGDIVMMTMDLPEELESFEGFVLFDKQVQQAIEDGIDADLRFNFHTHMILEHKLWQFVVDDKGESVYSSQEKYLDELDSRAGMAKSTMKRNHQMLRSAHRSGLTTAQIAKGGLEPLADVFNSTVTDAVGAPLRPKGMPLPEGTEPEEWFRDTYIELSEARNGAGIKLRSGDYAKEKRRILRPFEASVRIGRNQDGSIFWSHSVYDVDRNEIVTTGEVEIAPGDDNSIHLYFHPSSDGAMPNAVMDYLYRALKI